MRMSMHHAKALKLLGIGLCALFLLAAPALASSGLGLTTLPSGDALSLSLNGLTTTTLFDPGLSAIPTPSSPGTDLEAGADENMTAAYAPLTTAETEPAAPNDTGESLIAAPSNQNDASLGPISSYDDERLYALIDTASIRLMKLSMQHAHALYLQDTDAAIIAAQDLWMLSNDLLGEVQALQVTPEHQHVQAEFIELLQEYVAASATLADTSGTNTTSIPPVFQQLEGASDDLEAISDQASVVRTASLDAPRTLTVADSPTTYLAGTEMVSMTAAPSVMVAPPSEVLPMQERYGYDSPDGENMVSLIVDSTRNATAYTTVSDNKTATATMASDGRIFLLVAVKATNLGHKGDSDQYIIETPDRSAFSLQYEGSEFAPLEVPHFTSLGESYRWQSLERYESTKGYLFFDVPGSINISEATVRADLGPAGTPVWSLGTKLG
jgi:hypothetical protein